MHPVLDKQAFAIAHVNFICCFHPCNTYISLQYLYKKALTKSVMNKRIWLHITGWAALMSLIYSDQFIHPQKSERS